MAGALFLIAIGGALGYAAWSVFRLEVRQTTAIVAGALGALVFGTLFKMMMGLLSALLAAALGVGIVLYLLHARGKKRWRR